MSRFYASIDGQAKTSATRRGSKKSGIGGHIRGWDVGIIVDGSVNKNGKDQFTVWLSKGSKCPTQYRHIGTFTADDLEEK